jgi:polyisoprenoid-binding protein YceI
MIGNKRLVCYSLCGAIAVAASSMYAKDAYSEPHPWNLPAVLSTLNTSITFELDTTWHTVHGEAKQISGRAWLTTPADYKSVRLELTIPVSSLDTGSESRDEEMRDSMDAEAFPNISFVSEPLREVCAPAALAEGSSCPFAGSGTVTIRDVSRQVPLSGTISREPSGGFKVSGDTTLKWDEFGIKDPSILIAKVHSETKIHFEGFLR